MVSVALPPAPVFGRPGTLVALPSTEPDGDEPPEEELPPPPPLPEEPLLPPPLPLELLAGATTVPERVPLPLPFTVPVSEPLELVETVPESELVPAGGVAAPVESVPVISEASAGVAERAKSAAAIRVIDLFISVVLLLPFANDGLRSR